MALQLPLQVWRGVFPVPAHRWGGPALVVGLRPAAGPAPAAGPQQGVAAPAPLWEGPTSSAQVQQRPHQLEHWVTPAALASACLWALTGRRRAAGRLSGLLLALLLLLVAWGVLREGALMV